MRVKMSINASTLQWTGNVTQIESRFQEVNFGISGKCNSERFDLPQAKLVSCLFLLSQQFNFGEAELERATVKLALLDILKKNEPADIQHGGSGEDLRLHPGTPAHLHTWLPLTFKEVRQIDP